MTVAAPQSAAAAGLPAAVRKALAARFPAAAAAPVRWQAETATRLDTGSWLRRTAVHAAVIGDRLVAVAPGDRPVIRHWPLAAVAKAVYNHVTGELVLPPARDDAAKPFSLALDPLVARGLLALAGAPPVAHPSPSPGIQTHA
jgi:hypothetical protein